MDAIAGLIDIILTSAAVVALAGDRVFKGGMARIGEVQYPCVLIERRTTGVMVETAPLAEYDVLVVTLATNSSQSWRLHKAVREAIGRARWSAGSMRCTALARTAPFDLPPDEQTAPAYPVASIYHVRTLGEG